MNNVYGEMNNVIEEANKLSYSHVFRLDLQLEFESFKSNMKSNPR